MSLLGLQAEPSQICTYTRSLRSPRTTQLLQLAPLFSAWLLVLPNTDGVLMTMVSILCVPGQMACLSYKSCSCLVAMEYSYSFPANA